MEVAVVGAASTARIFALMSSLAKSDLVLINILYSNFLNSSRVELLLFLKQLGF